MRVKYIVIGDYFVDRYWIGTSERISPEAPVPVVKIKETRNFPGGAGNVAANIEALVRSGFDVTLLGRGDVIPIKNRLMVGDHQIARWDENDVCEDLVDVVRCTVNTKISYCHDKVVLVIADYGKGAISDGVLNVIRNANTGWNIYVDTKGSPARYAGIDNITFFPNKAEFEVHEDAYKDVESSKIVLKLGKDGICEYSKGAIIRKLPATCTTPYSVIGAGDTVIAAYCVAKEEGLGDPLLLANKAAGIKVGKKYTATVGRYEWLK